MRSFFQSLGLLFLLNLLVKPAWIFFADRPMQLQEGAAYGIYFSSSLLALLLSVLADIGLSQYFTREAAARPEKAKEVFALVFPVKIIFTLVYLVVAFLIAFLAGLNDYGLVFLTVMTQAANSWLLFFRGCITAGQRFKTDAWVSVFDKLLLFLIVAGILYLPLGFVINLYWFAGLQAITAWTTVLVAVWLIKDWFSVRIVGLYKQISPLLLQALPYAVLVLSMSVLYRQDGFLLERIHSNGAAEATRFASGYRLFDTANMAGYLVASFLLPFLARQSFNQPVCLETIRKTRQFLIIPLLALVVLAGFYQRWLLQLLYHEDNTANARILFFCILALPGAALVHIYGTVLTAYGEVKLFTRITILFVLIQLGGNIFLVPVYGADAVCKLFACTQWAYGIMLLIFCFKKRYADLKWKDIYVPVLFVAFLCAVFWIFG
jgi:O-antigen/teichoic acid export membrane protein